MATLLDVAVLGHCNGGLVLGVTNGQLDLIFTGDASFGIDTVEIGLVASGQRRADGLSQTGLRGQDTKLDGVAVKARTGDRLTGAVTVSSRGGSGVGGAGVVITAAGSRQQCDGECCAQ